MPGPEANSAHGAFLRVIVRYMLGVHQELTDVKTVPSKRNYQVADIGR
jgi:hypothetical protein